MNTRKIFTAFVVALMAVATSYAQPGGGMGGGRRGGGMGQGRPQQGGVERRMPDFVASAGIFTINPTAIEKETKVDEAAVIAKINEATAVYQDAMNNLALAENEKITLLRDFTAKMKTAGRPSEDMMAEMQKVREAVAAVKAKTIPIHKALNAALKEALSSRENKRWTSYYKELCQEAQFTPSLQEQRQRQGGEQGGQGRPMGQDRR